MQPDKNRKFLRFFIIIIFNFKIFFLISVLTRFLCAPRANAYNFFLSIGSYSPEVGAFGTLIRSTKVFRFIICKIL